MVQAVDIVAHELIAITTPGQGLLPHLNMDSSFIEFNLGPIDKMFTFLYAVDQLQLDRAKKSTKSAILMNLESRVCKL